MNFIKREKTLLLLFCFALALRLVMVKWTHVLANDGPVFINMARDFFSGDYAALLKSNSHPLYPILVGIVEKATGDWELAGKLVSAIAGSLLVIPFYIWGRRNFGERTAFFSTLFLAVSTYHVRYSADVLTESTYILFFFLAAITSIDALLKKRLSLYFWAGLLVGIVYLVRPEGAVLLAPLALWTLFVKFPTLKRKAAALLLLLLSVGIFTFPYMLYLKSHYGRWLITAKYDVGRISGLEGAAPTPEAAKEGAEYVGPDKTSQGEAGRPLSEVIKDSFAGVAYLGDKFAVTYHPLITLLLLYGVVRRKIPFKGNRANYYLLLIIVIYLLILFRIHMVYDWFGRRHILPLTVLALYWAGMSFGSLTEGLKRFASGRRGALAIHQNKVAALCVIIVLAIILPKTLKPQRLDKLPEKRAGIWLRENNEKAPPIITNVGRVAFYAGGRYHRLDKIDSEDLFDYAQKHEVNYIVVNERVESIHPGFFTSMESEGLKLVLSEGGGKEEKVSVFRIR